MKVETAKALSDLLLRHAREQNEVLFEIEEAETAEEFQRIKLMIGHTMASLYLDALKTIYDEHPELKPPELK